MPLPRSLLLLLLAGPGGGDVYFEQLTVTSTDGRAWGPGVRSRVWFAGRRIRLETGGVSDGPVLLLRLDDRRAYRLDPATRTAVHLDLERLRARSHMDLAMAADLMGVEGSARTRPLGRTKLIAGYACRGFRITAGATTLDLYVTGAIPLGVDAFAELVEWSGAGQALSALMAEIRTLPGFPLETRSRVAILGRVQETVATVTKVRTGAHPPGLFEPPPGYRIVVEEPPP